MVLKDASGNSFLASAVRKPRGGHHGGRRLQRATDTLPGTGEAANTFYYLWLIYNGTTVQGLISLSSTAPTLPSGFTFKALVGVVLNNGSSNFANFLQKDRSVWINTVPVFTAASAGHTAYASLSVAAAVPAIAKSVFGVAGVVNNVASGIALAGDANGLGAVSLSFVNNASLGLDGFRMSGAYETPCATAQTIFTKMGGTGNDYQINVAGYRI